jgi:serine protease Do
VLFRSWDLIEKYNDQIKNQSSPLTNDLKSKIQNLSVNINNSTKRSSSGFIFNIDKENGILYIATNKHCVVKNKKSSNPEKVDSLILKIQNHELVFHAEKANIFFPENCKDDIAIIRLQHDKFKNTSQFDGIQINQNVEEGDFVISAGNSLGLYNLNNEKNITQGRIINKNDDQIHHSCALFSGNSGGPLFDSKGNIVGVNYEGGFNESFAIPVKTLMKIFEQHPDNQIKKQKAKDNHQSKLIKNLIGFLAADVLIASATYFTTNKLIEQNKLSEKSMQTIYFGCIGLIAICIACLEIKQIQKNYQEFQQSKIELNKLEEHRNEHSQVL